MRQNFKTTYTTSTGKAMIISSIVIESIRMLLFFFTKSSKKNQNTNSTFKQTKNFLITLIECYNHNGKILVIKLLKN